MPVEGPAAYVRLIDAAVGDLERIAAKDPNVLRAVLKKMLLLESDPNAGNPLLGELVGFRKLTVGDRQWRIIWRTANGRINPLSDELDDLVDVNNLRRR